MLKAKTKNKNKNSKPNILTEQYSNLQKTDQFNWTIFKSWKKLNNLTEQYSNFQKKTTLYITPLGSHASTSTLSTAQLHSTKEQSMKTIDS